MKSIDELVDELALEMRGQQPVKTGNKKEVSEKKTSQICKCDKCDNSNVHNDIGDLHLTLSMSKEIAAATERAAEIMGVKAVVSICDDSGKLMLLNAMDDSFIISVKLSQEKAYTSVALKMPTHKALEEARGGSLDGLTNGDGIMLLGGGYPLSCNGKIYGGVGVSGGTKDEDTALAMFADEYFKARFFAR